MSEKTKIQWCDDTANFWRGCTKVSPGCANCYAEKNIGVKMSGIQWGKDKPRIKSKSAGADCLRWNKKPWVCDECDHANALGIDDKEHKCVFGKAVHQSFHRRRVFSLSLGDWLDPEVPIEWLAEMLDTIRRCDQLIFILCTKRPHLWVSQLNKALDWVASQKELNEPFYNWLWDWIKDSIPPKNVWLLASVENQEMAKRIPELQKIPAVIRGLSLEPLLEEIDLLNPRVENSKIQKIPLDWLIIGGESGPGARPCNIEWIHSLVAQGKAAGVATFVKQLGSYPVRYGTHKPTAQYKIELRDKKGGDISEWPTNLRVREFPEL